jgi:SNF2 family DNA or RNA helicase
MNLIKKNNLMVLYCTYEERDFPKSIGGRWNAKYKGFVFSESIISYKQITDKANDLDLELIVDDEIIEFYKNKKKKLDIYKITREFKTKPFPHQVDITSLIVQQKKSLIYAGVGTGKSKAAIDAISLLWVSGRLKKCLVICPSGLMFNFANQIKEHSEFEFTIITGSLKKRQELINDSNTVFDIINYEMISKLGFFLDRKKYDFVIFDEIHYCKNRASIRSKACYRLASKIPMRVGLTGTPICNSYEDLFMIQKIIDDTIFGTVYARFRDRYFNMGGYMGHNIVGYKNEEELKELIASNSIKFHIRDVIKDLPDEMSIIKKVKLNDKSLKLYKEMKTNMMIEQEGEDILAFNVLEKILRLSQITSGYLVNKEENSIKNIGSEKIEMLEILLQDNTDKKAVFCRFRHSIDLVVELCKKLKLSYYVYDGRTKDKELYLKYNNDNTNIWISQISKSEGYSIPSARYCIFYEMDYSRKNHVQAKGRILRATGNKHDSIFYIYLIADNTIDDVVYNTLKEKDFNSKKALEYLRGISNEYS